MNVEENVQYLAGAASAAITIERDPITMTTVFRTQYCEVRVVEDIEEFESLQGTLYAPILRISEGAGSSNWTLYRQTQHTDQAARDVLNVLGITINDSKNDSVNNISKGTTSCP